jgi:TonB family protein
MGQEDVPIAFFSYCREDSEFALKLAADLKVAGAQVWIDQLDIEPGTPWDRAVEDALTNSPRMLVVLSPVSVNSDNVRDEVSFALSRQKRVIPVLYRDCEVPFRLARLQHIDFRPDYERALAILVRALSGQAAHSHASSGAAVAAAVESPVSAVETEEQARQQKLEDDRRLAEDQAQLEQVRKNAAEQARLKKERETAAQAAREQEQQRTEAEARASQEQSRREQRAAEQARLEEETRLAAERVRLAQQEKDRREAEIKARQEQLRREEQESVERKSMVLDPEPEPEPEPEREATKQELQRGKSSPSGAPTAEPARPAVAVKPAAPSVPITSTPTPAAKVPPPQQPQATGANLTSPKYLTGGAILVVALGIIVFVLTHRGGPEKPSESKVAESKASETTVVQQPQPPAATSPSEPAPSSASPSAAAPSSASSQDAAKEKTTPAATAKELAKSKSPAHPQSALADLGLPVGGTPLNASNAANASNPANTAATPNRVRISQGVSHGLLMSEIAPKYPPLARSARVQGQVVLDVVIGKDGAVRNITAKSGHPLLVPAAIDAVKQWRYQPYRLDGKPVDVSTEIVVNFTLTN